MKNTKRRIEPLSFFDHTGISRHLEKMAAKGWMIEKIINTGWQLACTSAQLQFFFNERENPTPIETEPELQLQAIHASAKKSFIPSYIVLLVVALLNGAMWVNHGSWKSRSIRCRQ